MAEHVICPPVNLYTRAAKLSGWSRKALRYRLQRYGLAPHTTAVVPAVQSPEMAASPDCEAPPDDLPPLLAAFGLPDTSEADATSGGARGCAITGLLLGSRRGDLGEGVMRVPSSAPVMVTHVLRLIRRRGGAVGEHPRHECHEFFEADEMHGLSRRYMLDPPGGVAALEISGGVKLHDKGTAG